jgi:hypothetical protein
MSTPALRGSFLTKNRAPIPLQGARQASCNAAEYHGAKGQAAMKIRSIALSSLLGIVILASWFFVSLAILNLFD